MDLTRNAVDETGQKVLSVSWSGLKEFETCAQLSWRKRQPDYRRVKVDGRVFLPGTLADRAMRAFLEQPEGSHAKGQMAEHIDRLWDEYAENSTEYKIKWRGDPVADRAKVRDFSKLAVTKLEPFLFERVLPHEFQPEMRFRVPLRIPDLNGNARTIHLIGGIDIAVRHLPKRELTWLYDLKTTENDNYVTGILPQLIFYKIMWHIRMGTPFEQIRMAYLVPAAKTQFRPVEDSAEDRSYLMSRVVKFAHGVWSEEKTPVEDDGPCWNCPVRHVCDKWNRPIHVDSRGKLRMPF